MSNDTTENRSAVCQCGSSLDKLKEWDPRGAELLQRVSAVPAFLRRDSWS